MESHSSQRGGPGPGMARAGGCEPIDRLELLAVAVFPDEQRTVRVPSDDVHPAANSVGKPRVDVTEVSVAQTGCCLADGAFTQPLRHRRAETLAITEVAVYHGSAYPCLGGNGIDGEAGACTSHRVCRPSTVTSAEGDTSDMVVSELSVSSGRATPDRGEYRWHRSGRVAPALTSQERTGNRSAGRLGWAPQFDPGAAPLGIRRHLRVSTECWGAVVRIHLRRGVA